MHKYWQWLRWWLAISRPRFWMYLFGPLLIGIAASVSPERTMVVLLQSTWLELLVLALFFLFPANLFIYGVNDWADGDTDQFNQKKGSKEILLQEKQRRSLKIGIQLSLLIGVLVTLWLQLQHGGVWWLFVVFFVLGAGYSLPPLRFKARPFIDAYSNLFYWLPALIVFRIITGEYFAWQLMVAATAWTTAMQAFSAVPDIEPDAKAGLRTTAVVLGKRKTLWFCAVHWLIFALIVFNYAPLLGMLALIYPALALLPSMKPSMSVDRLYWYFPRITAGLGFIGWWYLVIMGGGWSCPLL